MAWGNRCVCVGVVAVLIVCTRIAGQQPLLLKQTHNGTPAVNLTSAELVSLGDPFFELVLRQRPDVTLLSDIENLLQPNTANRVTFVVDENIRNPGRPQARRAVLAYTGTNSDIVLDTNVMISVAFSSEDFPDRHRFIEAWGWDNERGRYNYYKLDSTGTPDTRLTWKFRGSSDDADLFSPADREGTCMACHSIGAPVMKELSFPWNNWHSSESAAGYLTPAAPAASRWPVASHARIQGRLKGAEDLEATLFAAITQFNNRRINRQLARSDADGNIALENGRARVLDARRLLRSLFETTEVNFISARQKSGLHPALQPSGGGPSQDVLVPTSFFLNANLIAGGTPAQYQGLGISAAQTFRDVARITPAEYARLVKSNSLALAGRTPADADFAWFTPEPSHVDVDMADRLLRRGIVLPEFVAAVMLVDLESPMFSAAHSSLLRFLPDTFTFVPVALGATSASTHPDQLTQAVIAAIKATSPAPNSAELQFLHALENASPVSLLTQAVTSYRRRVASRLQGQGSRQAELDRLFATLIDRRVAVLRSDLFGPLDETGDRLLPVPVGTIIKPPSGSGGQVKKGGN